MDKKMKNINVVVERGNDNTFSAYMDCETFDYGFALLGYGTTVGATITDFYASYEEVKEIMKKEGKTVPDFEFNFTFDTASLFEFIDSTVTQGAVAKASGINPTLLSHYATRRKKPRDMQRQKIVMGLHKIGKELLSVS
jgi:hypothetical protein